MSDAGDRFQPESMLRELQRSAREARGLEPEFTAHYRLDFRPDVSLSGITEPPDGVLGVTHIEGYGESAYAVERLGYFWTDTAGRLIRLLLEDENLARTIVEVGSVYTRTLDDRLRAFLTEILPSPPELAASDVPVCRSAADVAGVDGCVAVLEGRYEELDVRQRPKGDAEYRGHAAIVLADGTRVLLQPVWHADAIRPESERTELAGRAVRVMGTVHRAAPESPDETASLMMPCVREIAWVRPVGG